MTPTTAGFAQTLLRHVLINSSSLTDKQLGDAGATARNLLSFAWQQEERSSWLVTNAIRSVCATIRSDVQKTGELLRKALQPEHLSKHGFEEAPCIAIFASEIAASDPELAADIYGSIFSHEENSTSKTDMISSRILPMTSNRRQDYDHSKWQLTQKYERLIAASLASAARAMVHVAEACAYREQESVSSDRPTIPFAIGEEQAGLVEDYSYIWDHGSHVGKANEMQIVDSFFKSLSEHAQNPEYREEVTTVLEFLITGTRPAIVWRRLLELGAEQVEVVGLTISKLASAVPLLGAIDTEDKAEQFVAAVYPLMDESGRRRIEEAVLSLPEGRSAKVRDVFVAQRNRIIAGLPRELLLTAGARGILADLDQRAYVPEQRVPRQPLRVTSGTVDDNFILEHVMGVSATSEPHKEMLELQRPVQRFAAGYSNSAPSTADINANLPHLRALKQVIDSPSADTDPKVLTMACGTLADACGAIAGAESIDCRTEAGVFVLDMLIEFSSHPEPQHDPDYDNSFDKHPSWGSPIPRIEAADGLIKLARFDCCTDARTLAAIERLLSDPVPAVRFQIATQLGCLYTTANHVMWRLIERVADQEGSNAVLERLGHVLHSLAGRYPDRVAKLCLRIFNRIGERAGSDETRETYVALALSLYLWKDVSESADFLFDLIKHPLKNHRALSAMLMNLRGSIALGASIPNQNDTRTRALELFRKIVASSYSEYVGCMDACRRAGATDQDRNALQQIVAVVIDAADQLYFASGVFDRRQSHAAPPPHADQEFFYSAVADSIDTLSATGLPGPTHHLVEMLEDMVPLDSRRVFLQIARMIESGRTWGYEFESMAVEQIVKIVDLYLADYRALLQHDVDCRVALRNVLDTFVNAGWPAAQRLSYRLEEIFR